MSKINFNKCLPLDLCNIHEYDLKDMFKKAKKKKNESLSFLVMPDMHFGEHCEKSMSIFRQKGANIQPDGLMNIGDYYGLEYISTQEKRGDDV